MRRLDPIYILATGAVVLGALVSIGPYIPDDWGWFLTMTVFGMGGGLATSLVIGTVVANMFIGAAFGALLIIAGKPELNASLIAWAVYALRFDRSRPGVLIQEPEY
jgi:hypothetical protein